jgi:hypothetical protein
MGRKLSVSNAVARDCTAAIDDENDYPLLRKTFLLSNVHIVATNGTYTQKVLPHHISGNAAVRRQRPCRGAPTTATNAAPLRTTGRR